MINSKVLARIPDGHNREIVISLCCLGKEDYRTDIRENIDNERFRGFTKRGLLFHREILPQVILGLDEAMVIIEENPYEYINSK